jgi:hypothetical protein
MPQSELDEWAEDHAQRVQEELATKGMLAGLQRMQDRLRDEIIADVDRDILRQIQYELSTRDLGTGAPAPDQARADQEDPAGTIDQGGQGSQLAVLSIH